MKKPVQFVFSVVLAVILGACSANPAKTHEAGVLDDKVTEERVQQALKGAGADFQSVQAQVTDGVVVLSGTVRSEELRSRAEGTALGVHRVSKLEDKIQVQK